MVETLPLEEFEKYADNVYEAVVIIAKRARQINELQKRLLNAEVEAQVSSEDFDDEGISKDYVEHKFLKLPKPTTLALQEMLEGKLQKEYPEKE